MPSTVSVLYPNVPGAAFDLDYYLTIHMPLVRQKFGPYGLRSWRIVQVADPNAPYTIVAIMEWDELSQFAAAAEAEGAAVFGDIPNFSNQQPVVLGGTVVGNG